MKWKEKIRPFLSFSMREKRGILLWVCLMVVIILFPLVRNKLFPPDWPSAEELAEEIRNFEDNLKPETGMAFQQEKGENSGRAVKLFPFNPNENLYDDWLALGLTPRQARTADNYLKSGGAFRVPADLKKIYGLDSGRYALLEPYIRIPQGTGEGGADASGAEPGGRKASLAGAAPLELNTADSADLQVLPGVGPVLASRLVRYRLLIGGFYSIDQVGEVYGLDDTLIAGWGGRVWIDSTRIRKMDLNRAGFQELIRHPYLDYYHTRALVQYRESQGKFSNLEEIRRNRLLPDSIYRRIAPYLEIGHRKP